MRSYPSLLNYWLLIESEEGRFTVFSCMPTAEPMRLQQIVPKPTVTQTTLVKHSALQEETNRYELEKEVVGGRE